MTGAHAHAKSCSPPLVRLVSISFCSAAVTLRHMWCPLSSAILSPRSSSTPRLAASRIRPAIAHQTGSGDFAFQINFQEQNRIPRRHILELEDSGDALDAFGVDVGVAAGEPKFETLPVLFGSSSTTSSSWSSCCLMRSGSDFESHPKGDMMTSNAAWPDSRLFRIRPTISASLLHAFIK
jgi:hypothetical protein